MSSAMSLGLDNNWLTTPPFIAGLGAPMRRIGVLMNGTAVEVRYQAALAALWMACANSGGSTAKIFASWRTGAAPIPPLDGGAGNVLAAQLELVVRLIIRSVRPNQARNVGVRCCMRRNCGPTVFP